MYLHVEEMDLLTVSEEYAIAHCLSADLRLNMGIVVQINRAYDLKTALREAAPVRPVRYPDCIRTGRVLNLITKEKYNLKPTLDTLTGALIAMREICEAEGIMRIAMPRIGCGLDKLEWTDVEARIREVFGGCAEMEIMVCVLPGKR